MDRAVAVSAVDVDLVVRDVRGLQSLRQFGGGGEDEIRRAPHEAAGRQCPAPSGVGLVGNDQVDALPFEKLACAADDFFGVFRRGQTIDQRAEPHVSELLVLRHLRVQQDRPTDDLPILGDLQTEESGLAAGIEDLQRGGVAHGRHGVVRLAGVPEIVGPFGEMIDDFRGDAGPRVRRGGNATGSMP